MKKTTLTETCRKARATQHEEVMAIVGLTQEEQYHLLFEYGLAFARQLFQSEDENFKAIVQDKLYWNWFKLEWKQAHASFVRTFQTFSNVPKPTIVPLYKEHIRFKTVNSKAVFDSFHEFIHLYGRESKHLHPELKNMVNVIKS